MFMFHAALSLTLIALTAGCALYISACRCEGKGTCFSKFIGMLVILISLASTVCTVFYGIKAWQTGGQCEACMMHGMQDNAMDSNNAKMMNDKAENAKGNGHKK